jgi:hypothetical protein
VILVQWDDAQQMLLLPAFAGAQCERARARAMDFKARAEWKKREREKRRGGETRP